MRDVDRLVDAATGLASEGHFEIVLNFIYPITHRGVTTLEAYHVRRLTLLISPDAFNMRSPIRVIANCGVAFEGMVRSSVETLRRWAANDADRTMLYAAEVTVELESDPE